jgi:hypothetical protein
MHQNTKSPRRPSAGLIVAVIALVAALAGTAIAAPANTVKSKQIVDQAVKTRDIRDLAVTTEKLADQAVTTAKLADSAVDSSKIADFTVADQDLAANSVFTDKIADETISSQDIAQDAVGSSELALTVRTAQVNIANGDTGTLTKACNAGEQVMGGGGGWPGVPNGTTLATSEAAGGGWTVEGKNTSGSTQTLIVQAFCLG